MKAISVVMAGAAAVVMAGCATPSGPIAFELVDEHAAVYRGTIDTRQQAMAVTVGARAYAGFYVVATDSISTTAIPALSHRFWPTETRSSVSSNIARAHLKAADGERLACEFMFEGERAVGSCKTQAGASFQFVAGS